MYRPRLVRAMEAEVMLTVEALREANPHLTDSDLPALQRLVYIYDQLDTVMSPAEDESPLQGKLALDEFHRLCTAAIRLEQELALTYSARRTRLEGGIPTAWPPLSSVKSDGENS